MEWCFTRFVPQASNGILPRQENQASSHTQRRFDLLIPFLVGPVPTLISILKLLSGLIHADFHSRSHIKKNAMRCAQLKCR